MNTNDNTNVIINDNTTNENISKKYCEPKYCKQCVSTAIKIKKIKQHAIDKKYKPYCQFLARHVVETLYDVAQNEYMKTFEPNFSLRYYGEKILNNLAYHKTYGDFVIIKNVDVKYFCYETNKYNHECPCTCEDCFQDTYSIAKIIGKYKTGEYQVMVYFWWDPMEMKLDRNDIRKINNDDIVGIVFLNEVSKRYILMQEIEKLPNSIYKSE